MRTRIRKQQKSSHSLPVGMAIFLLVTTTIHANTFTLLTPGGPVEIEISHAGPTGSLIEPGAPRTAGFRPPSIFAAPLPSGSGARALGLGGAFTAIADDATAASWNPAGLVHLETPEASIVYRASLNYEDHSSLTDSFLVGEDHYDSHGINYFSLVYPFRLFDHNFVVSLNYQEAYDFTQRFSADMSGVESSSISKSSSQVFQNTQVDSVQTEQLDLTVTSYITTHTQSQLSQLLGSDMLTRMDFKQQGTIDAISPAMAIRVTPYLSFGVAINVYGDALLGGPGIRSTTRAEYEGTSSSGGTMIDERTTTATYEYEGTKHTSASGSVPPSSSPISRTVGVYDTFSDTDTSRFDDEFYVTGSYEERNAFDSVEGINATLGGLWFATESLALACAVDLPWEADATQTKTITTHALTYGQAGGSLLHDERISETMRKDVTFEFPLYWSLGARWKWTECLRTALDVSQTLWSDFSFQASGESKLNPLDGTPHGENPVDDCWSVRLGTEYVWHRIWTEIPFRAGVYWDQRPAVGTPDNYWGFSLGSGIFFGEGSGKIIIDAAYIYRRGEDVMGSLVPDRDDLRTDVEEHEFFLSAIRHF
jgi:long-subunit fatty acid transport protein